MNEKTTIVVKKTTNKKLNSLKYSRGFSTLDETIDYLLLGQKG